MNPTVVRLQWLALALLAVGLVGLQPALLLSWLAVVLTGLAALKLLEAKGVAERRLVALLQLVCAGLLGALQSDLGPSLLQMLAVFVALAGLLALETGAGPNWKLLLRRSLQVVAAALPMAMALFLLLPRLEPFAAMPGLGGSGAVTGLSASLAPGGIATLVGSNAPAARVAFGSGGPPPPAKRYWRVLVHERFDGERWTSSAAAQSGSPGGSGWPATTNAAAPPAPGDGVELWLSEASGLTSVSWGGSGQPLGQELRVNPRGELRHRGSPAQRRIYAIRLAAAGDRPDGGASGGQAAIGWRWQAPTPLDLQLPGGANPRLEALAAGWAQQGPPAMRLAAAEAWFRSKPFRYTQQPGTLPATAPLDAFLFERRQGFCGHYASAFTALMRAAGVPARVVSGYRGGDLVKPLGGPAYLDIRQNDAHAWSEVWLEGEGWRRVDPTSWVAAPGSSGGGSAPVGAVGWLVRQWWGLDLAWGRWWLGFDRSRQEALLNSLLGGHQELVGALVVGAMALGLGGGLAGLGWLRRRPGGDRPRQELERTLRSLARHGLVPRAGETLPRFAARIGSNDPALATAISAVVEPYQRWRYGTEPPRPRRAEGLVAASLRGQRRRLELLLRRQPPRRPPP